MPVLKNARHELFAQEVAKGAVLVDAYAKAGYKPKAQNANRLIKNEPIQSRIAEIQGRGAARAAASVERIVEELEKIAFSDVTDVLEIRGRRVIVKDTRNLPREVTGAIAGIKKTKAGIEVRFHNKAAALDALARHKGMYRENIDLTVTVGLVDLVNASYPVPSEQPKVIDNKTGEEVVE